MLRSLGRRGAVSLLQLCDLRLLLIEDVLHISQLTLQVVTLKSCILILPRFSWGNTSTITAALYNCKL